MQNATKKLRKV